MSVKIFDGYRLPLMGVRPLHAWTQTAKVRMTRIHTRLVHRQVACLLIDWIDTAAAVADPEALWTQIKAEADRDTPTLERLDANLPLLLLA